MNRFIHSLLFLLITCSSGSFNLHAANKNNDFVLFEKIFTDWTLAFNQKNWHQPVLYFQNHWLPIIRVPRKRITRLFVMALRKYFSKQGKITNIILN